MSPADGPSTSPTLLELLRDPRNDAAWRRFVETYTPVLNDACRRARLQPADADEVRSRVLSGLVTALRGFRYDPASRFRGYLRAAVNNAVRTWRAERATRPGAVGSGDSAIVEQLHQVEDPDPLESVADELDGRMSDHLRELYRRLERVRAQVEPDTWQAYSLTALDGRPAAEVAAALGKSVAAVYMAKSRVAKLLRAEGAPPDQQGESP